MEITNFEMKMTPHGHFWMHKVGDNLFADKLFDDANQPEYLVKYAAQFSKLLLQIPKPRNKCWHFVQLFYCVPI